MGIGLQGEGLPFGAIFTRGSPESEVRMPYVMQTIESGPVPMSSRVHIDVFAHNEGEWGARYRVLHCGGTTAHLSRFEPFHKPGRISRFCNRYVDQARSLLYNFMLMARSPDSQHIRVRKKGFSLMDDTYVASMDGPGGCLSDRRWMPVDNDLLPQCQEMYSLLVPPYECEPMAPGECSVCTVEFDIADAAPMAGSRGIIVGSPEYLRCNTNMASHPQGKFIKDQFDRPLPVDAMDVLVERWEGDVTSGDSSINICPRRFCSREYDRNIIWMTQNGPHWYVKFEQSGDDDAIQLGIPDIEISAYLEGSDD